MIVDEFKVATALASLYFFSGSVDQPKKVLVNEIWDRPEEVAAKELELYQAGWRRGLLRPNENQSIFVRQRLDD